MSVTVRIGRVTANPAPFNVALCEPTAVQHQHLRGACVRKSRWHRHVELRGIGIRKTANADSAFVGIDPDRIPSLIP